MVVLFRLWTKVKIFLVFVKLELPDVLVLPNPMKMTLKAALKLCDTCKGCVYFVCYLVYLKVHSRSF
jgi:hypothetical protein